MPTVLVTEPTVTQDLSPLLIAYFKL